MNLDKIGKLISVLRKQKGLTQVQLGDMLGISDKSVSKWERGINAPDISLLNPLSDILDISVTELLNGEKNEKEIDIEILKFYNNLTKSSLELLILYT